MSKAHCKDPTTVCPAARKIAPVLSDTMVYVNTPHARAHLPGAPPACVAQGSLIYRPISHPPDLMPVSALRAVNPQREPVLALAWLRRV